MLVITAQTIQQIVTQLYDSKLTWDYLNYLSSNFKEDMMGEMILQLMQNEKQTIEYYNNGILLYYVFSSFKKMKYPTSKFYKAYLNFQEISHKEDINNDEPTLEKRLKNEEFFDFAKENCYNKNDSPKKILLYKIIFELYFNQQLSLRKIQKCTGVNYRQVWEYVTQIKENIKNKLNDYDRNYNPNN